MAPPETTTSFKNPGTTYVVKINNVVFSIERGKLHDGEMRAVHAKINIEGGRSREAYGVNPEHTFGHPMDKDAEVHLHGFDQISEWRLINQVAGQELTLTVTIFYR